MAAGKALNTLATTIASYLISIYRADGNEEARSAIFLQNHF